MAQEENKSVPQHASKVDKLADTLYSRTRYKDPLDERSQVRPVAVPEVGSDWKGPELEDILSRERTAPEVTPFMKKVFVFAVLFFIAAILVGGFVFYGGSNFISSKNVDIAVTGPATVPAGETLELEVTIENGNNADLELANFSIQYPQGSRDPENSGKELTYTKENLGVIEAGDEVTRNVRLIMLGSTGEVKELKFSVEYKVRGSNATFYKDKSYEITIGSAPLSISVETPASVTSGESFKTLVTVKLNATTLLKNVMLRAEYPYGYSVTTAEPAAFSEGNVWVLGDMVPGSSKTIDITGRLLGENQDERTFRFYTGVSDSDAASPNFKTVLISTQETIAVERPALGLAISFSGETSPVYVAPADRSVSATIRFQNNMPEKILNPKLEVRFSGALNESSVVAYSGGFYDSSRDLLSWNISNNQEKMELSPGEGGSVSFNFSSLPEASVGGKEIGLTVTLSGTAVGTQQPIRVAESRTVKIASQVTLASKALHSIGPFDNTGPIPPQVEKETTYTIVWSVGNTQNDLTDAKVTARLGSAVRMVGANSAASEDIAYNEALNTLTWNIGTLASGTGFSAPAREVAFQVAITPSLSQVGTTPILASSITFSGFETVAAKTVTVSSPTLTTKLPNDPAFIQGDDIVVR